MISYTGVIQLTSTTLQAGIADPSNGQVYIVESTGPTFRKYSLTTLAQVGSSVTCLSSPGAVCLINSASSVISSTGVSTVDFIENSSGYRTNVSGGNTLGSFDNQRIAADTASGIAFYVTGTSNQLTRIVASSQTVSNITIQGCANFLPACIILRSTGSWLVGGRFGKIYEIDSNGNILNHIDVQYPISMSSLNTTSVSNLAIITISGMSYDGNLLYVETEHMQQVYDYSTGTMIWQMPINQAANTPAAVFCASASGETLVAWNNITSTENNTVQEVDFTTSPVQTITASGTFYTNATNKVVSTGFCAGTNLAFAVQQTAERIYVFNVVPRSTVVRTVTVQIAGVNQLARLMIFDDTSGTAVRLLDTYFQSPGNYRLPTGRNIIEVVKVGDGANALWDVSRYST
jgi:hypothetical protein